MRTKLFVLITFILAAIAMSACGPTTLVANPAPPQRSLDVTGTGMVYLAPDVAYINIGVHTEKDTAADAVAENNTQTQQVIAAIQAAGVDVKDIKTSNFSIYPNTQYDPQTSQKIGTTYVVDNTVNVTVRKLDQLGNMLDAAVKSGANSVNSVQFDVFDKTAALQQARTQAVKDAQTQAQQLAGDAGVSLGDVQSITFVNNIPTPIMDTFGKGGGAALAAPSVPIQSGQMVLTVTVSMTYNIK